MNNEAQKMKISVVFYVDAEGKTSHFLKPCDRLPTTLSRFVFYGRVWSANSFNRHSSFSWSAAVVSSNQEATPTVQMPYSRHRSPPSNPAPLTVVRTPWRGARRRPVQHGCLRPSACWEKSLAAAAAFRGGASAHCGLWLFSNRFTGDLNSATLLYKLS